MIEIIAIVLIIVGIFFIIRGLSERAYSEYDLHERYETDYRYNRLKHKERLEWVEEGEEEFEETTKKRKVKAGGVVLIGPIPIVFGDSKYAVYALILAIILMLLSIFFLFSIYI